MSERPAPIPSPEKVLDALRQAGWLLEQDTQTELTRAGFVATPGAAFPDPDDKTASRDIDVMGWKTVVLDEDQRLHVAIRVLAECKQSSMPYVVVGRSTTERDRSRPRPEHTFSRPAVTIARVPSREGGTLLREVPSHRYLGLESVPPWSDDFVATQMTRLDLKNGTWSAGNDGIFTSLVYPLAKASAYFHAQTKDARGSVELRFPVVVTSAPVFQLNVDDEEMVPKIVPWTTLARNITTASLKGNFRIDVVSYSALGQYLSERIGPLEAALRAVPIQKFFTSEDMEWEAPATM